VLIWEHHAGYIDRAMFEQNQLRIAQNAWRAPQATGAVREGSALLQGIAVCGRCGRRLNVHYDRGRQQRADHLPGTVLADGRGGSCLRVGGVALDEAVAGALLEALTPAGVKAALAAAQALELDHDRTLEQWRLQVERANTRRSAPSAATDRWSPNIGSWRAASSATGSGRCRRSLKAEAELDRRERARPRTLTDTERPQLLALGSDLGRVWSASTTTDRDRKALK